MQVNSWLFTRTVVTLSHCDVNSPQAPWTWFARNDGKDKVKMHHESLYPTGKF
jgi:hypothetical protein